jgi:hypothetical protein
MLGVENNPRASQADQGEHSFERQQDLFTSGNDLSVTAGTSKLRSAAWHHFTKLPDGKAKCNYCQYDISTLKQ